MWYSITLANQENVCRYILFRCICLPMLPRPYACKYARALMCIYCMYVKALFTASWKASKTWNDKHSTDFCLDHLAIPSPTMDSTYIDRTTLVKSLLKPCSKKTATEAKKNLVPPHARTLRLLEPVNIWRGAAGQCWFKLLQQRQSEGSKNFRSIGSSCKTRSLLYISLHKWHYSLVLVCKQTHPTLPRSVEKGSDEIGLATKCNQPNQNDLLQLTSAKVPGMEYDVSHMYSYPTLQSRLTFAMFEHISHDGFRCPALHGGRHGARRVFPETFVKTKWKKFFACILHM